MEAQVNGAVALGLSQVLLEEAVYKTVCRWGEITTCIRSCQLIAWLACMCELSRAGQRWAALASRPCRRFPRRWRMPFPA
ncbi:hypothetical protein [Serratia odorifera]|uniref:hypothetical protein n=1 Tax=Serratia odorifera TaxID=618 RepID=UPI0022392048|nr:hypothetical protein [Serratia odorifera]